MASEIGEIRRKLASTNWPRFVMSLSIEGVHGLSGQQIDFKFPVCAIVGENGTCKSTILKTLACAYKNNDNNGNTFFPSDFFLDTAWDRLSGVALKYQIRMGNDIKTHTIAKRTERWRGLERPENRVYWIDLNRIQPIDSIIGSSKLANKKIKEIASRNLTQESVTKLSEVMGRDYLDGRYVKTSADNLKELGLLKLHFGEMSQFHQGTGESIISNLLSLLENIPDHSLVIMDEIESSLHPKAQRRLIKQLLKLARIKTLQIVFSTHSPYILSELPPEARILLTRLKEGVEIVYAPSVEFCLSQIDDEMHSELYVLVEDSESKILVSEIIRYFSPGTIQRISVLEVGSADVIEILMRLQNSGKSPYKILGFVDADQNNMKNALKLPGNSSPEKQIVTDLNNQDSIKRMSQIFNISEVEMQRIFEDVLTIANYHEWIEKIASKLNASPQTVWNSLVNIWIRNCLKPTEASKITDEIRNRLS